MCNGYKMWKPRYDEASDRAAAEKLESDRLEAEKNKDKSKTSFTQDEVNAIIAKERAADKKRNEQLVQQLESLKSTSKMTSDEKLALETRIEELKTQHMTKEELAARDRKKLEEDLSGARDSAINEAKSWKTRYESSMIQRSLVDEAVRGDAFSPNQIMELLSTRSKVVEATDDKGKALGQFVVQIAFDDVDKDKKPVTLQLTPAEAVKRMKELPERFGNLFKSGVRGGLGSGNASGTDGSPSVASAIKSPEAYRSQRAELKKQGVI